MKLKEWLSVWLEKYTKHTVKLRTYDRYKYIIEKHINPKLGDYDLDDLNGEIFQDFVLSELENGNLNTNGKLANNSVIGIVNVLKGSMALAKSFDKVQRDEIKKIKTDFEEGYSVEEISRAYKITIKAIETLLSEPKAEEKTVVLIDY